MRADRNGRPEDRRTFFSREGPRRKNFSDFRSTEVVDRAK